MQYPVTPLLVVVLCLVEVATAVTQACTSGVVSSVLGTRTITSSFCYSFNQVTVTSTKTSLARVTISQTTTKTAAARITQTQARTVTQTFLAYTILNSRSPAPTVTVTTTSRSYEPVQTIEPGQALKRRQELQLHARLEKVPRASVSNACSCIAPVAPTTTVFRTITSQQTVATVAKITTVTPTTVISVTQTKTITSPRTLTRTGAATNTVTATVVDIEPYPTQLVCNACNPGSASTYVNLRIEGESETIFEGCVYSGPGDVTTPSGGTHACDSTNNGANEISSDTPINALAYASNACNFAFDGTYDSSTQDFTITSIGSSTDTETETWGLLQNFLPAQLGGCETAALPGDDILWAFGANVLNAFLRMTVSSTRTTMDTPVIATVVDGTTGNVISGALIGNVVTGDDGQASLLFTRTGSFSLKATFPGALRSNAVIITVTDAETQEGGVPT